MKITFTSTLRCAWFVPIPVALISAVCTCVRRGPEGIVHGLKMGARSLLLFGFVSAVTGPYEINGSLQSLPLRRSIALGSVGLVLTGLGINRAFTQSPG